MSTSYLDQCCRILEENMEYESDRFAVLLVRVQQLSQSIAMTLTHRKEPDEMPLAIIVQNFEHEINQLRKSATHESPGRGKTLLSACDDLSKSHL